MISFKLPSFMIQLLVEYNCSSESQIDPILSMIYDCAVILTHILHTSTFKPIDIACKYKYKWLHSFHVQSFNNL